MIDRRRNLLFALGGTILLLLVLTIWLVTHNTTPERSESLTNPSQSSHEQTGNQVDLAGWKLSLPTAGDDGIAASVDPAEVKPPWLTRNDDGSLTFWAPVEGATTKNSSHPRTELINLTDFKAGDSGEHTMRASAAVTQVPSDTKDIIVGQIHGSDDIKSLAFVMLHYRDGKIHVVVKQKRERGGSAVREYPLIEGVALGQQFEFTMTDNGNGHMSFSATSGGQTNQVTAPVPDAFSGATVRFQAGDYQQSDEDSSSSGGSDAKKDGSDGADSDGADSGAGNDSEGGRVTFYGLSTD